MQQGEIIEKGNPKSVYENPKNKYIASLFGDVNEIVINGKTQFVYPHQLKVVDKSNLKVTVVNSYFRGSHYLIEAQYENGRLFFESMQYYQILSEVFLTKKA